MAKSNGVIGKRVDLLPSQAIKPKAGGWMPTAYVGLWELQDR